jgi:putative transcriptional regulator
MTFAERIKEIRRELNMSQEAFARHIGVAFATVSRWERGHRKPSQLSIWALERKLNIKV